MKIKLSQEEFVKQLHNKKRLRSIWREPIGMKNLKKP